MEEFGRELTNLATTLFPGFGYIAPVESDKVPQNGVFGALRGGAAQASGLFQRIAIFKRKPVLFGAGGLLVAFVIYLVASSTIHGRHAREAAVAAAAAEKVAQATAASKAEAVAKAQAAALAQAAAQQKAETEAAAAEKAAAAEAEENAAKGEGADDGDATAKSKGSSRTAPAAADNKNLLEEAQRLLHAERFAEARTLFEKVAKSKRDRGQALVGLAEISFQEKNYSDVVRSASQAVDRGGGVRARVLLGDAYFRLNQYKDAAKAYDEALKLDPKNVSAKAGLAAASRRM
jgi:cytochrome c-type biogenesis protein CcmH/NrfG